MHIYSHLVFDSAEVNIARSLLYIAPGNDARIKLWSCTTPMYYGCTTPSSTVRLPYIGDMLYHMLSNIARLRVALLTVCPNL